MPLFTLHRNFVLRTTRGHTIRFEKKRATHVPNECVNDAVGIGAVPVDNDVNVLGDEEEVQVSLTPEERKAKVFEAFDIMVAREERGDFTASGVPNAKRLPPLTEFEVTSKERDSFWMEYKVNAQEQKDQDLLDAQTDAKSDAAPES